VDFRSCPIGVTSFITIDEQLQLKPRLLFFYAGYDSWGLSFGILWHHFNDLGRRPLSDVIHLKYQKQLKMHAHTIGWLNVTSIL